MTRARTWFNKLLNLVGRKRSVQNVDVAPAEHETSALPPQKLKVKRRHLTYAPAKCMNCGSTTRFAGSKMTCFHCRGYRFYPARNAHMKPSN